MLTAGQLRNRVEFLRKTRVKDAAGQTLDEWVSMVTTWGDFRYQSGLATIKSDAQASIAKASLRIRYRTDITPDMVVQLDGQKFDIDAVLPDRAQRKFVDLVLKVAQ